MVVVSDVFKGKPLLQQHRLVNKAIEEEMKSIHALTLKTKTCEQYTTETGTALPALHHDHSTCSHNTSGHDHSSGQDHSSSHDHSSDHSTCSHHTSGHDHSSSHDHKSDHSACSHSEHGHSDHSHAHEHSH